MNGDLFKDRFHFVYLPFDFGWPSIPIMMERLTHLIKIRVTRHLVQGLQLFNMNHVDLSEMGATQKRQRKSEI
jgi:hypothetical protein